MKDVSECIGGSATFKCKLPYEGAPVEWIHNGKQIYPEKNPQKYEIITDGLSKVLVIKNLKEEEQGMFGVKIGENLCTAKLQVQGVYLLWLYFQVSFVCHCLYMFLKLINGNVTTSEWI